MLQKVILLFSILLLSSVSFAQNKIDSLLKITEKKDLADSSKAQAYIELADFYYNQKEDSDSTILYAEKGERIAKNIGWKTGIMKSNYFKGGANALLVKYELASKQLFEALKIAEEVNDKPNKAMIIKEIGYVFLFSGNHEKAVEWFNKMYEIFIELGDKQKAAFTLGSIGTVYHADSNNVEAIKYFKRALKIGEEIQDQDVLGFIYTNLGTAYFYNGQRDLGFEYVLKSKEINEKLGSRYNVGINLANLTHFAEMKGDLNQSLKFGLEAVPILEELGLKNPLRAVLDNLRTVYFQKGDFNKAYQYQQRYFEVKDEIDTENVKKEAEIQELEYDAEKDQLEIDNLNKDIENRRLQQLLLIGGLLLVIGIGGVLWWTNKSLNKKNALIAEQKASIEEFNKDLELKVAKRTEELQVALDEIKEAMARGQSLERKRIASDLHDNLGSVISAINFSLSGISREKLGDSQQSLYDNVVKMTESAYQELRSLSHNLLPEKLEKEGLIVAIQNYLESLNAAQPVWFDFTTNTEQRFSAKTEVNLYAIILECCNNILKHAKATEASIEIQLLSDSLEITVTDNGKGFLINKEQNGNGLANMKDRLSTIDGIAKVDSNIDGTTIHLKVGNYMPA
ncbi:Signal transduction histidine kinase [Spirosomataceae bacterium TFI 002]|nr:Signal transduction histidine kinase [Spirosomataceae bacterium TFI 002]